MPSALPLRTDYSPAALRRLAKKTKDNNQRGGSGKLNRLVKWIFRVTAA